MAAGDCCTALCFLLPSHVGDVDGSVPRYLAARGAAGLTPPPSLPLIPDVGSTARKFEVKFTKF